MFKKLLGLLSDAAIYGASSLISQLVGLFLVPLLTYYLSKAEMGTAAMLAIVPKLFLPLANLGMTNAIFRRFNQEKDAVGRQRVLSTGLGSVILSSLALGGICLCFVGPISDLLIGDRDSESLVAISIVAATVFCIGQVPRVALRANRNVKTAALLNVLNVFTYAGCTLAFVVFANDGVRGVILSVLLGDVITTIVAFLCTTSAFRPLFEASTWKGMLSYGLPFVPHHVQAVLLSDLFGRYVLRDMLGLGQVGLYDLAGKFAMPVVFVVTSVQTSWVAYKFQIHADEADSRSFFRSTFTYYCAGLFYLWLGVSLWGPELLRLLSASEFHAAATLVPAIALIPVAQGMYYMLGTGMELTDNTRPYPLISLAGLITVVMSAFLLVDAWGAYGAAAATAVGWLVMAVAAYLFAQRRLPIPYDWPTVIAAMLLSAGFAAPAMFLQSQHVGLRLGYSISVSILYPVCVYFLLARSATERERMQILWDGAGRRLTALRTLGSRSAAN